MDGTTRHWLPTYCDPGCLLPSVQETVVVFRHAPYLFEDFVGKAAAFLHSERVRALGFDFDTRRALPCTWKCSDESLFGVDLALYAYSGAYPFDKGKIGGRFNDASLGAAVHHAAINIDFGGAHVGYRPGPDGGSFGHIGRPLRETEVSTNCGYLMHLLTPFKQVYDDACRNIVLFRPEGAEVLVSIPNEFLHPGWSSQPVKLLVDPERLTAGTVPYDVEKAYTHKLAGRSLFHVNQRWLAGLAPEVARAFGTPDRTPIGAELSADLFTIFDSQAEVVGGMARQRLLPYMKHILSSRIAPYPLKAAVTSANIEHNKLVDAVRAEQFRPYSFASFTGVFIDVYDPAVDNYVNLFQPVGIAIKPAGRTREVELEPEEIHHIFDRLEPAPAVHSLRHVLGYERPRHLLDQFTFRPASRGGGGS